MKHGEAPWFLMWSSALLFAFGMVWAWLVNMGAAKTVTILDMSVRSGLLLGAGMLGTVLGQFGMLWAWRRYVRATEDVLATAASRRARDPDEITDRAGRVVPSATADHRSSEAQAPPVPTR